MAELELADGLSLPHKQHDKHERKDSEESHHSVNPADIHSRNPRVDIEADSQPIYDAVGTNHNTGLGRIMRKALNNVVDCNRHTSQGSNGDKEDGKCQYHIMQVVLQGCTKDAQSDWVQDKTGNPEHMKTVLRLPGTLIEASGQGERKSVVEPVSVELDDDDSDPVAEGESGVLL